MIQIDFSQKAVKQIKKLDKEVKNKSKNGKKKYKA